MIPIDYTNLTRLDLLWVTSFVSIFSIAYSRITRVKGNIIVALFGALLSSFGFCSIICETLFKPFSLAGGLTYGFVGFFLCLYMSDEVRYYILKSIFSRDFLQLLHEKPLINILMESAPSSKIYTLLALSSFLSKDELNRMVNTLPDELDYIRQPGIVNLFPAPINHLLAKSINTPTSVSPIEARRGPNDRAIIGNDDENNNNTDSFEKVLSNIIQSRSIEILSHMNKSLVKTFCSSLLNILQGCDISNSTLLKTVGVTTMVSYVVRHRQFDPFTCRILKPVGHVCKVLSIGCGSMLLFRELISSNKYNRDDSTTQNQSFVVPHFLKLYNFVVKGLISAKIKISNDSVVASFCIISCALSVALGHRLRASNFREVKWIYDIFLTRLIQCYKSIMLHRE